MSVAAIDCGTNSTRLLIADDTGRVLRREMRITRLGQDVDATGTLADEALQRNFDVLTQYARFMEDARVTRSRLIATSAARDAANGAFFLERAAEITGARVALLSGNEEAQLSLRGATADLPDVDVPTMILDIGGGSTEMAAMINGTLLAFSMQLGCVRVTERALGVGVLTTAARERANEMIEAEIQRAWSHVPDFERLVGRVRVVGLAGTVATLAQLVSGVAEYDRERVHHQRIALVDVVEWCERLGREEPPARLRFPGMVVGREDVLPAGLLILESVLRRFEVKEILSSENDILDGLAATMVTDLNVEP